jgi:hypothetical protein
VPENEDYIEKVVGESARGNAKRRENEILLETFSGKFVLFY